MKLAHFSHPHPLIFKDKQRINSDGEEVTCSGCEEPVLDLDLVYICGECNFHLHKKCAELPREINQHLHPQHPLLLLEKPSIHYPEGCICDFCERTCNSFVYHCSLCKFDLHIKCALPPCIFEAQGHPQSHQFICLGKSITFKSFAFTCNACGTDGDECPYLCHMCGLLVHKHCVSLPNTINVAFDPHPISHTYCLQQNESGKRYCGICQIEVKTRYGCYNCPYCNFLVHVECAIKCGNESKDEKELDKSTVESSTTIVVREIILKDQDKVVAAEIKHFSHQHNLILIQDIDSNHDENCNGCMLPISLPLYGCAECNFFLHETCVNLPKRKVLFHSQRLNLILFSKAKTTVADGIFKCVACNKYCNGFVYYLKDDPTIALDVRCTKLIFNSIKHQGHEHPLFYAQRNENYLCSACNDECYFFFTCPICNFILDFKCATLPYKQRHRFDNHPLFLTYDPIDDGSDEYYCDICEMKRDPKFWVYYCKQCDFAAHPDCINKNPFVKLGGTFTYDIHPHHPLTLVQKSSIRKYPRCHSCCEPCDDLALECTVSGCKFIVHRKNERCYQAYDLTLKWLQLLD